MNVKHHTDRWVRWDDFFLRHTWLYLYSTRTIEAIVLSQEQNLGEGSEHSIIVIMTLNDSSEDSNNAINEKLHPKAYKMNSSFRHPYYFMSQLLPPMLRTPFVSLLIGPSLLVQSCRFITW